MVTLEQQQAFAIGRLFVDRSNWPRWRKFSNHVRRLCVVGGYIEETRLVVLISELSGAPRGRIRRTIRLLLIAA